MVWRMASTPADDRSHPVHVSARWSWAALVAAFAVWFAAFPTSGFSVVLAPLTLLVSLLAWRRARHDAVFWIGLGLNLLLALALVIEVAAVLTGEASVGWE
jgi:hypothetical protein